jgi:hypothetical protein
MTRTVLIALCLVVLLLAGCSDSEEQETPDGEGNEQGEAIITDTNEQGGAMVVELGEPGGTLVVEAGMVMMDLWETDEAFPNPMKGFRPTKYFDRRMEFGEYTTVYKHYIKYTDLEATGVDTARRIIDWGNEAWVGIEEKNIKVIPRVVIMYPNGPDNGSHGYWAEGIPSDDPVERWLTDTLMDRLEEFIFKLAEAWDYDPRVAAIEIGLWGSWGEHHIWPLELPDGSGDRIPAEIQKVIGDACAEAFTNKKLMVRYPETFLEYDTGFYWDSFALPDNADCGEQIKRRQVWRTQMITGETAYDWGDQSLLGGDPSGTLRRNDSTDYVIGWIKDIHASSLGWVADYDQNDPALSGNAAMMQKALGYRFVLGTAMYPAVVRPGGRLPITFTVANMGSAPFYYQWPVQLCLLDAARRPVFGEFIHVDIRKWSPGHSYTVFDSFTVPEDLPPGEYVLALAVLDPAGFVPALRFANINYYNGGYTPLGIIGIGVEPARYELLSFDSLYNDRSLYYTLDTGVFEIEDRQTYRPERGEAFAAAADRAVQQPGNLAYKKPVSASSTESQYDNYDYKAMDRCRSGRCIRGTPGPFALGNRVCLRV